MFEKVCLKKEAQVPPTILVWVPSQVPLPTTHTPTPAIHVTSPKNKCILHHTQAQTLNSLYTGDRTQVSHCFPHIGSICSTRVHRHSTPHPLPPAADGWSLDVICGRRGATSSLYNPHLPGTPTSSQVYIEEKGAEMELK